MKSRACPEIEIFVNGENNSDAKLLIAERSTGRAGLVNSATFTLQPRSRSPNATEIKDDLGRSFVGFTCEVVQNSKSYTGPKRTQVIHFGRIVHREMMRSADAEKLIYTSRLDNHMVGGTVQGRPTVRRPRDLAFYILPGNYLEKISDVQRATVGGDIVFNPMIDGLRYPNRSYYGTEGDAGNFSDDDPGFPLFVEITQIPRDLVVAKVQFVRRFGLLSHQTWDDNPRRLLAWLRYGVTYWRLRDAIHHLIWTLNPLETYVSNPLPPEIHDICDEVVPDDTGQYLNGFTIEYGTYLTDALDQLLSPFGLDFKIQYTDRGVRKLVLINQQDWYNRFKLPMQEVGDQVDSRLDKIQSFRLHVDEIQEAANTIEIVGGYPLAEVTLDLVPAWSRYYDTTPINELALHQVDADPDMKRVWRDWVGNETGEYDAGGKNPLIRLFSKPDFTTIFADRIKPYLDYVLERAFDAIRPSYRSLILMPFVERRRRLLPMLTCDDMGAPLGEIDGVHIEFSVDEGETWTPVTELEDQRIQILRDEIGIRFNGMIPPIELISAGVKNVRLRATGCLEADSPLQVVLGDSHDTIPDERRHVIQLPEQFVHNYVVADGPHKSQFATDVLLLRKKAHVRDDSKAMALLASKYLDAYFYARMEGSLIIDHIDYIPNELTDALGARIIGDKRNLKLHTGIRSTGLILPVIRRIGYDNESQTQTLVLDSQRLPIIYW